jgi:phenylacetate-CoA ligase
MRQWPEASALGGGARRDDELAIAFYDAASAATIRAFQYRRAAQMIEHMRQVSPWWRDHLGAAAQGGDARWSDLPLMDRAAFRSAAAAGPLPTPASHGASHVSSTSGSTGVPVQFHASALWARLNRHHHLADLPRQGFALQASYAAIESRERPEKQAWALAANSPVYQRNAKAFSVESHARWLAALAPTYLTTTPTLLGGMLDAFEAGEAAPPRLQGVITYAETVTADLRARARRLLGARIADRYCCEEIGLLAVQCPRSDERLHAAVTNALLEILDADGRPAPPGEIGRVFATGLHNWASPAVRYELGDLAAWRPGCPCGFQGLTLERLLGRTRFLVRLPSGERTHARTRASDWLDIAPVREQRVVQVSERTVRAEVVVDRPLTASEQTAIRRMLAREISPALDYEVVQVEAIAWGPSYKRQDVVSLV